MLSHRTLGNKCSVSLLLRPLLNEKEKKTKCDSPRNFAVVNGLQYARLCKN